MNEIESKSCIKFVSRGMETDYVEIFSGNGCFASVGRRRGMNPLSLMRSGCLSHGIIIHELFHNLGLFHMQSSHDRDEFVRINFQNIARGMEHNFNKYPSTYVSHFGTSYDLDSIMHYARRSFSMNGLNTIETINPNDANRIGQRSSMSLGDVQRLNKMYCN